MMAERKVTGVKFGQKRPPLYDTVKNILRDYPKGQIFKEIIQNADDARATEIKFFLDSRSLCTLPSTLTDDDRELFTCPALLSFNNAPFKEEDWESIQNLYNSSKANNPHKVGKFGIGFNSVYHITDLPVIVSQDYCGFFEPQEQVWKGESGRGYYLKALFEKCPEALAPFDGICGFSKGIPYFKDKTLFRFPLRNKASKLSRDVYNINKLRKLLDPFKEEAQYLLVFLRSVCSIEVLEISLDGTIFPIFKVNVDQHDCQQHMLQQHQLLSAVESTFPSDTSSSVSHIASHQIIKGSSHFSVTISDGSNSSKHEWLVATQVGSQDDEVIQIAERQHVLPWVGTAVKMTSLRSSGRIFCVLPLPIEDGAPFCVHVNGTFAVSSNRRSLKWEVQERKGDEESTWNKLLVEKCFPSCYVELISKLMECSNPAAVYTCWPDIEKVCSTPWSGLLEPFYKLLLYSSKVVHTPVGGGQWVSMNEGAFIEDPDLSSAVYDAVLDCDVKLVELNDKQWNVINKYYTETPPRMLTPSRVRSHLKFKSSAYEEMSRESKLDILGYCLEGDCVYANLVGLTLLPLANGKFQEFERVNRLTTTISAYVCTPSIPYSLLPGQEHMLISLYSERSSIHDRLLEISKEKHSMINELTVPVVGIILSRCHKNLWSHEQMTHFWNWLKNQDLIHFQSQQIVPVRLSSGVTKVLPLAKENGLVYVPPHSSASSATLVSGLEKCGINIANAHKFSYLTHSQLLWYLYQLEPGEVLDAMKLIDLTNVKLSNREAVAIQKFLSLSHFFLAPSRLNAICSLPLFSVVQYATRYSINSMRTPFVSNISIAMKGSYEFKTDLLPKTPLVICVKGNEDNLLLRLVNYVCFMTDIEYLLKVAFLQISQFPRKNVTPFMKSVLNGFNIWKYKYDNTTFQELVCALKLLPFIEVPSLTSYRAPCDLFDPEDHLLLQLFSGEQQFPGKVFHAHLPILRECGLKTIDDVTAVDILQTIRSYSSILPTGSTQCSRARAVLTYLTKCPHILDNFVQTVPGMLTFLDALRTECNHYFWLPVVSKSPHSYPSCLSWKGSCESLASTSTAGPLVILSQDMDSSQLPSIAGSQAIFVENAPSKLAQCLSSSPKDLLAAVLSHFQLVIANDDNICNDLLQQLSIQTYSHLLTDIRYLSCNPFQKWIWIEKCSKFVCVNEVAIAANPTFKMSLEPFMFVLSAGFQRFSELFTKCGMESQVSAHQIISVLQSIKDTPTQITSRDAWSIVRAILNWLVEDPSRMDEGNVLVPVKSNSSFPQLLPAKEVTYTSSALLHNIAQASDDSYSLIHSKVAHLSSQLNLSPLSDHLDITEDVFEDAGQHEPLTTRLSNILREYKDGLTIIKEMIQNADDAGATQVNILYDTRKHPVRNLLFKGMAGSHGPALIVHNDGIFTEEDFENITKLASATKADQPLKIGKFGVGFCSVYHITDVPSFISGEWLYIFDPTLKYLKGIIHNENRPGKRMKYQSKIFTNSRQLAPYHNMFGFNSSSNYSGTMFRLPFRTSPSEISSTIYNRHLISQMKEDLSANGSQLLLFLQHVKRITFGSINDKRQVVEFSIECSNIGDIRKCITNYSSSSKDKIDYWLVSLQEEMLQAQDGFKLATTSIACQLVKEGKSTSFRCKAIEGNVFCFLPLAVPSTGLPVHVSANFAVMSNRSGIWTSSSEIASDSRESWNQQLIETIIPKAYCNLLLKIQEMCYSLTVKDYVFYMLWPLNSKLKMKLPWKYMMSKLYIFVCNEALFYSTAINDWLHVRESTFLISDILNTNNETDSIPECVRTAANVLKLKTVHLPVSYMDELKQLAVVLQIMNELEFIQTFFVGITCFNGPDHFDVRNTVLFHVLLTYNAKRNMLTTDNDVAVLSQLLLTSPCIPTTPNGITIKKACEVIDPDSEIHKLFLPEEQMFPIDCFIKRRGVCQAMVALGLLVSTLPWDLVVGCASKIEPLHDVNVSLALERVHLLVNIMERNLKESPVNEETISSLKSIPFLPVYQKPTNYTMQWEAEGIKCLCSSQLLNYDLNEGPYLVGTQWALVNTLSARKKGCGNIPVSVLRCLGVATQPSVQDVLQHFCKLIDHASKCKTKKFIEHSCQLVYMFLNAHLQWKEESVEADREGLVSAFKNKPFVWTGKEFVCPENVAEQWRETGPTLFSLSHVMSTCKTLKFILEIKSEFNTGRLLETLKKLKDKFNNHQVPYKYHKEIGAILYELNAHSLDADVVPINTVLPDEHHRLHLARDLSYNSTPWLPVLPDIVQVHSNLNHRAALALGVKPSRDRFLDKYITSSQIFMGSSFGQSEKLTQKIKNILRDYPLDVTFLKELLQNADDAKATKMYVILDKRQHGVEKVPSEEWGELQGPAVLVWNDTDFSDEDLEGIQKLGLGSKRDDNESIGQFGIGFNVVYHVTDCPSFITRGNVLCIFDPHCRYAPGANSECPGRRYDNIRRTFWKNMSDLCSSYLRQTDLLPGQPDLTNGTLFRFPLRTREQFESSELLDSSVATSFLSVNVMEEQLTEWVKDIESCFIFLKNVKEFFYYTIERNGFECQACFKIEINRKSEKQRSLFHKKLSTYRETREPFIVTYQLTVVGSRRSEWLVQQGVGNLATPNSQELSFLSQTLPLHGIAAPLNSREEQLIGNVFCFLPLPIASHLPVHINGRFILSSNRRSLWSGDKEDVKTKWNRHIIEAIASSYAYLLVNARDYYVGSDDYSKDNLHSLIHKYYSIFPMEATNNDLNKEWLALASEVYRVMWDRNLPVLATEQSAAQGSVRVTWHWLYNDNPFEQVYFRPVKTKRYILPILKMLGMLYTRAPYSIYCNLKEFKPAIISQKSVFAFYTKFYTQILEPAVCPCLLSDTPFQSVQRFKVFLQYLLREDKGLMEFCDCPFGHPLILAADGCLRFFDEKNKLYFSEWSHLFPNSLDWFVHPQLLDIDLSQSHFVMPADCVFNDLSDILDDNLPTLLKRNQVSDQTIDEESLIEIWKCITTDCYFQRHLTEIVNLWALIPAENQHKLYSGKSQILPIVMLPEKEDSLRNTNMFKILKFLTVPVCKDTLHSFCYNYCPDISNYDVALNVVFHFFRSYQGIFLSKLLSLSDSQMKDIFMYLRKTSLHYNPHILQKILRLPLFKPFKGQLTALHSKQVYLWPITGLCDCGYDKWAPSETIVFLDSFGSWQAMCDFSLLGKELFPCQVYCELVFPVFSDLDSNERREHLMYIRDKIFPSIEHEAKLNDQRGRSAESFIEQIRKLPCLDSPYNNDQLLTVSSFSDHTIEIFTTFEEEFIFLCAEYRADEWLEFLYFIGLCSRLATEMFLKLCMSISKRDHKDMHKASAVLVQYLFSSKAACIHNNSQALSRIGDIPFVVTADLNQFSWIRAPYRQGLTKFNEAIIYKHASLVWTVKPVVQLPRLLLSMVDKNVLEHLRLTTNPHVEDVFQNIISISRTEWADFQLFTKYSPSQKVTKGTDSASIVDVIADNIEYLQANQATDKLKELSMVSYIPVSVEPLSADDTSVISRPVLVNALQVVQHLSAEYKGLRPHINVIPIRLSMRIYASLHILGVTQTVELKHIQYMLKNMFECSKRIQNPNDKESVRLAVLTLHDLLKGGVEEVVTPLYLPSVDEFLIISTQLTYLDTKKYKKAKLDLSKSYFSQFQIPPQTVPSTVSHCSTQNRTSEKELSLKLPANIRPHPLSLICQEEISSGTHSRKTNKLVEHFNNLQAVAHQSALCTQGLARIVKSKLACREDADIFCDKLVHLIQSIQFKVINNLVSQVSINSVVIGRLKTEYLLQKVDKGYTLYCDANIVRIERGLWKDIAHTVCVEVAHICGKEAAYFLDYVDMVHDYLTVQSVQDFQELLEESDIQCNDNDVVVTSDDQLIELGQSISNSWIPLLDNNINNIFRPQEWVGYEVSEDNFIWALVIHPLKVGSDNPLMEKYVILIGEEKEISVSILDLYKVVTDESDIASQDLLIINEESTTTIAETTTVSPTLKLMKRKVFNELKIIWTLPENERKKAIRRMYFQYHPDKADYSQVLLYEEVFKFLKQQVDHLESNLSLLDPDELQSQSTAATPSSFWTSFYDQWKQSAYRRKKREEWKRSGGESMRFDSSFRFQPKADKEEAKRWIRQAESDLEAMDSLYICIQHKKISSHVIFMAHQVMEKSLKAGMYAIIGLSPVQLKTHYLSSHAIALGSVNSSLLPLKGLVSNMESYYLDTRYPNRHPLPKAPVDQYTLHDATVVVERTRKVYNLIVARISSRLC